jgi:hypothetical protein
MALIKFGSLKLTSEGLFIGKYLGQKLSGSSSSGGENRGVLELNLTLICFPCFTALLMTVWAMIVFFSSFYFILFFHHFFISLTQGL